MSDFWRIVILLIAIAFLILFVFLILRTLFPEKKFEKKVGISLVVLSILTILINIFLIGG